MRIFNLSYLIIFLELIEKIHSTSLNGKQDFLEAEPYYDQSTVPVNVYKNKAPFTGKIVSTKRIVGPKATGETCHIIIDPMVTSLTGRANLGESFPLVFAKRTESPTRFVFIPLPQVVTETI